MLKGKLGDKNQFVRAGIFYSENLQMGVKYATWRLVNDRNY